MNHNVTASFSLSVSLVVLFAVLLYQPDDPAHQSLQASPIVPAEPHRSISGLDESRPQLTPGFPLADSSAGPKTVDQPRPSPSLRAEPADQKSVGDEPRPAPGGPAEGTSPVGIPGVPTSAFTHAMAGESLADIAVRIYGSPESARKIWMANRDLIYSLDATPSGGTLLRTP